MKLWTLCLLPLVATLAGMQVASVGMGGPNFVTYPTYNGIYNNISGSVQISTVDLMNGTFEFTVLLTNAEPNQTHSLHIHSGVTCAVAADIGGHFWAPFNESDPWNSVFFQSDNSGNINSTFQLAFGYGPELFVGHAVVVHLADKTRAACGLIINSTWNGPLHYETASLHLYPNYTTPLSNATGTVEVWDVDSTWEAVNFRLSGLEPNVTGGVHIHVGMTCATSGAHFYNASSDPWATTTYTTNTNGVAEGAFVVASGYLLKSNMHHAVVVHDRAGTRVACGVLGGMVVGKVLSLAPYPNYVGTLATTGNVVISAPSTNAPGVFRFEVSLTGGEPSVNMSFHIHSGVSCGSVTSVGGHLWAPFNATDPWNMPKLPSDAQGNVWARFDLAFGYGPEVFVNHAVVVHDSAGVRVACGIIADPVVNGFTVYQEAVLGLYPGYNGTRNVTGTIQVWDLDSTREVVNFRLAGLASSVQGGVHIHVGTTCETSGAHYFTAAYASDPWTNTTYQSNSAGLAEGAFVIASGYLLKDNTHHAVVVHDADGSRIACGLLGGPDNSTNTTNTTDTTNTTTAVCPNATIQAVFMACKVYDFSGSSQCSATCSTSLHNLISAFEDENATVTSAIACLDLVNATSPWTNGALATLKTRINFNGTVLCNVTDPGVTSGSITASSFLALIVSFSLLFW